MKKLLVTAAFLLIASVGFSQFNLGAKVGANFSKLSTDISETKEAMKPGFDIGLFARLGFGNKFYLQPEVLYSFQSFKTKEDNTGVEISTTKTHNILIPILVGYKLFDAKLMNVRAYLGPSFGINVGDKQKVADNNPSVATFNVMSVSGDIGIGIDIAMIALDVKYSYGFTNAYKDYIIDNVKGHNSLFSISLGWKFL